MSSLIETKAYELNSVRLFSELRDGNVPMLCLQLDNQTKSGRVRGCFYPKSGGNCLRDTFNVHIDNKSRLRLRTAVDSSVDCNSVYETNGDDDNRELSSTKNYLKFVPLSQKTKLRIYVVPNDLDNFQPNCTESSCERYFYLVKFTKSRTFYVRVMHTGEFKLQSLGFTVEDQDYTRHFPKVLSRILSLRNSVSPTSNRKPAKFHFSSA